MPAGLITFLFFFTLGCSIPRADEAVSQMNQYWEHYKVENYDSLRSFYIPKGDNPEERIKNLFNALHSLHTKYGNVRNVKLVETTTSKSLEKGDRIDLVYEVEFDKKVINNQFSFKKDRDGKLRIIDHAFNQ